MSDANHGAGCVCVECETAVHAVCIADLTRTRGELEAARANLRAADSECWATMEDLGRARADVSRMREALEDELDEWTKIEGIAQCADPDNVSRAWGDVEGAAFRRGVEIRRALTPPSPVTPPSKAKHRCPSCDFDDGAKIPDGKLLASTPIKRPAGRGARHLEDLPVAPSNHCICPFPRVLCPACDEPCATCRASRLAAVAKPAPAPTKCATCGGAKRLPSGIARGGTHPCQDCDPELAGHYRIMIERACPDCGAPATFNCSNNDPLGHHCRGRSSRPT